MTNDDQLGEALAGAAGIIAGAETDLVELYKDIHQHPELGFQETRTAGILAGRLREYGYEVQEGIGGTGVVGILRNGEGPTVMYRADMDANAVRETTGRRTRHLDDRCRPSRCPPERSPTARARGWRALTDWMSCSTAWAGNDTTSYPPTRC